MSSYRAHRDPQTRPTMTAMNICFDTPCHLAIRGLRSHQLGDVLSDVYDWDSESPSEKRLWRFLKDLPALSAADVLRAVPKCLPDNGRHMADDLFASAAGEVRLLACDVSSDAPDHTPLGEPFLLHWRLRIRAEDPTPLDAAEDLLCGILPAAFIDQEFVISHNGVAAWNLVFRDFPQNLRAELA
jgi:hypothetical protein